LCTPFFSIFLVIIDLFKSFSQTFPGLRASLLQGDLEIIEKKLLWQVGMEGLIEMVEVGTGEPSRV